MSGVTLNSKEVSFIIKFPVDGSNYMNPDMPFYHNGFREFDSAPMVIDDKELAHQFETYDEADHLLKDEFYGKGKVIEL